jgi:hypothetical protein
MRRKISIAKLVHRVVIALAFLMSMHAGPMAAGVSCIDCATGADGAASAKQPCPKTSGCIVAGNCAIGCVTDTPLHAAAAAASPRLSESIRSRIAGRDPTSQALKPDPYPPRSRVYS